MNYVFFNEDKKVRNGWWVLIFLAFLFIGIVALNRAGPVFKRFGLRNELVGEGCLVLISLLATWACTRIRKEHFSNVGFRLNTRWAKELAWGTLLGGGIMLMAAGMLWAIGGVTWTLNPARSLGALGYGFGFFILVALFEETLFRGFVFQRLLDGIGEWPTQLILALLFGIIHWGNPGMHGATKLWATLDIALAAVFLGLGYLRTRSLALPIGIHLGWNWTQGYALGFGVSGTSGKPGWIQPVFQGKPDWVSGGAFGLEASIFGVIAVLIGIFLLWKWKGSTSDAPAIGRASVLWNPKSA